MVYCCRAHICWHTAKTWTKKEWCLQWFPRSQSTLALNWLDPYEWSFHLHRSIHTLRHRQGLSSLMSEHPLRRSHGSALIRMARSGSDKDCSLTGIWPYDSRTRDMANSSRWWRKWPKQVWSNRSVTCQRHRQAWYQHQRCTRTQASQSKGRNPL